MQGVSGTGGDAPHGKRLRRAARCVGLLVVLASACATPDGAAERGAQGAAERTADPTLERTAERTADGPGEQSAGEERQVRHVPTSRWLSKRGQFDPRPYDRVLIADGALGPEYFAYKNRLWIEDGVAISGYVSNNSQWGSRGGPSHHMAEGLLLGTWEPLREANTTGSLVVGFAYDQVTGGPTTRAFADNQGLVETTDDLDTDPDQTFATLGLLHWSQDHFTGPTSSWNWRAGQLYGPSYFGAATYLDDDRRYFMARPLATAAGAQWVGFNDVGLGATVTRRSGPMYASIGAMDGNANRKYPDFPSLAEGRLLHIGELGYEQDPGGPTETALRVTATHLDLNDGDAPQKGPGQSLIVSGAATFEGHWAVSGR